MYIEEIYFSKINDYKYLDELLDQMGLSMDELEEIVGRFRAHSRRSGQLRGQFINLGGGKLAILHHFTKKTLWSNYD